MTRAEAYARNLSKFDGAACGYGHAGVRYVGNGACVECASIKNRRHAAARAEKSRKRGAEKASGSHHGRDTTDKEAAKELLALPPVPDFIARCEDRLALARARS